MFNSVKRLRITPWPKRHTTGVTAANPTALIWCLHKSGSVFITHQILSLIYQGDTRLVEPTGGEEDWLDDEIAAKRTNHIFCAIRVPQQIRDLEAVRDLPKVLIYRDPRDVIVSYYFSTAFSHPVPEGDDTLKAKFLADREKARRDGLEKYVLNSGVAELLLTRYGYVIDHLLDQPKMLVIRYEDFVTDYKASIRKIMRACAIRPKSHVTGRVLSEGQASLDYNSEDPNSHKRQIWPGDHKRKLTPETIEELNTRFRPIMEPLGYRP